MNEICNESTTLVPLELGFIQKVDPWMLSSHSFPSKVGGRPAWLSLRNLPQCLTCQECDKPLCFLLQVYAPIEAKSSCFHRSIYVFICRNGACYQEGKQPTIKAFRSQLHQENPYYIRDTIDLLTIDDIMNRGNIKPVGALKICAVCGCHGSLLCGTRSNFFYCSKEHQVYDMETSHEVECGSSRRNEVDHSPLLNWTHNSFIFPEFELFLGPDPHHDDDKDVGSEKEVDESEMQTEPMVIDSNQRESDNACETKKKQKFEDRYRRSILREPNQVLRYHRGGEPLWISEKHRMETPPACSRCGAPRQFEFQVLPQMLNHLSMELQGNSIDWGSLFVFSCSESCDIEVSQDTNDDESQASEYVEEFIWKQDFVE